MTLTDKLNRIRLAEEIGRLLDNEVPEAKRDEVEAWIDAQPGGAELLNQMSSDYNKFRQAMADPISDSALERFTSIIDTEFAARGERHPGRRPTIGVLPQLAAALVLVAGTSIVTGLWMQNRMDIAISEIVAHMETERSLIGETVQRVLETRISGEAVTVNSDGAWSDVLTPIQTYKSKSGHWCRHYIRQTEFGGHNMTIRGTACRDENGVWTTVVAEPIQEDVPLDTSGA